MRPFESAAPDSPCAKLRFFNLTFQGTLRCNARTTTPASKPQHGKNLQFGHRLTEKPVWLRLTASGPVFGSGAITHASPRRNTTAVRKGLRPACFATSCSRPRLPRPGSEPCMLLSQVLVLQKACAAAVPCLSDSGQAASSQVLEICQWGPCLCFDFRWHIQKVRHGSLR